MKKKPAKTTKTHETITTSMNVDADVRNWTCFFNCTRTADRDIQNTAKADDSEKNIHHHRPGK